MALLHYTLALVFGIALATTQPVMAQSTASIGSGVTDIQFDPTFESTVSTLGFTMRAADESTILYGLLIFPVVEGAVDLDNARGEVIHSGGFHLMGQSLTVTFINPIVDTTSATPVVTAGLVVNNATVLRIPLFELQLPPLTLPLDTRTGRIDIAQTSVTLRAEAAALLNQLLSSTTFTGGQLVGTSEMTWVLGQSRL
jgi:hypothetical protein